MPDSCPITSAMDILIIFSVIIHVNENGFYTTSRIPTVKLKFPGKAFLNPNPELLLHSSYRL